MLIVTVKLESIAPYSQGAPLKSERKENEPYMEHEERCWLERVNADAKGHVIIPAMAYKNCLTSIAQYTAESVPGKRGATYTKHFKSGLIVDRPLETGVLITDVLHEWMFVPSNGVAGAGSRVWKKFPLITYWCGVLTVHILDKTISESVFTKHLRQAGNFIGVGRFRPQNNGFYGRFGIVGKPKFEKIEEPD